ncbi:MAG: RNA polymerase sigma factor region1.1 domain-containing protein, partial [Steroidobacteraceae bacterium]
MKAKPKSSSSSRKRAPAQTAKLATGKPAHAESKVRAKTAKKTAVERATHAHESAAQARQSSEKRVLAERRTPVMPEDRQSQLKLLIARGKEQGYLTYSQVNDHLPSEIVDPEQIEDIVNTINEMGIPVYEKAPDTESLLA